MSTSNPTARPEALDYLLWCTERRGWLTGLSSAAVVQGPDRAARWSGDIARGVASGLRYLRAVPLSDALRDGPPVEAPEASGCECRGCVTTREQHLPWQERTAGSRMFVCPECGNKRCPRALSHHHSCTGSNEPGQVPTPVEAPPPGYNHPGYRWNGRVGAEAVFTPEVCPDCGNKQCPRATDRFVVCMEPRPLPSNVKIRVADSGRIEGPAKGWGPVPLPYEEPGRVSAPTSLPQRTRRARLWMAQVMAEVDRCQRLHRPFASQHEGLAIFEEEADEVRHEVRHGTPDGVRTEAIQAAAMLVRLLVDCGGEPPNGGGDDE